VKVQSLSDDLGCWQIPHIDRQRSIPDLRQPVPTVHQSGGEISVVQARVAGTVRTKRKIGSAFKVIECDQEHWRLTPNKNATEKKRAGVEV
jgi:hypothetical protein